MIRATDELATMPVKKLVLKYSIPSIIAMLVNSIYNMVDRIFVGHFVGEAGLAGLTVVFPAMMMSMAFATLFGGGAAPLIAIRLGEKKEKEAACIFGNLIIVLILSGAVITAAGLLYTREILILLGAAEETLEYALPYMRIIIAGTFFQITAMNLSNVVRTEGHPRLAMISQIGSALINIFLDFLFVVVFRWGIQGAAYATITGQIFGAVLLGSYYLRGKSLLKLDPPAFKPNLSIMKDNCVLGASMFIGQFGTSFAMTFLNIFLVRYGGTQALTAMGAINSLYTLFIMPLFGLQMGMQPVISFNHGAGHRERKRATLLFGIGLISAFSSAVWILLQLFPAQALSLFINPSSGTMPGAVVGLRYFILMLPVLGFQFIGNSYFQAINHPMEAIILNSMRQFILLIPMLYILAPVWGLNGVWAATPAADGLASIVTAVLLLRTLRNEKKEDPSDINLRTNCAGI